MKEEAAARIRLAGRILRQLRFHDAQPLVPAEMAQLQFLAESDEERAMPVEKLAMAILQRETRRLGFPPASNGGPGTVWPN